MSWVEADAFRALFRAVPMAVGIVAVRRDGIVHATTVSSFCSLSLEPALLMLALHNDASILGQVRQEGGFGLSVLAHDQRDLALRCAERGPGALDEDYWEGGSAQPQLKGAVAWAGCQVEQMLPGGDHQIVVARVVDSQVPGGAPLLHHDRAFHRLADL